MAVVHFNGVASNQLHSKDNFGRVEIQTKKMPESLNSGNLINKDLGNKSSIVAVDKSTITESSNFYKKNEDSVSIKRFIKLNDCESTFWLMANHPVAYLLLNLVAIRAQRTSNHPSGLLIGEAFLGDYEAIGATRQQYRTALDVLTRLKYLAICETCRTRKKSTTGITTKGTKVRLLSSDIWDINPETHNHPINQRPTTDQPPTNHEQECKECKEEDKSSLIDLASPDEKKISSSSKKRKKVEPVPLIERDKGIFTSQIAHQKLVESKGNEKLVLEIYSSMAVWKAESGICGGDDYKTALNWNINKKRTYPKIYSNVQPKFNHDDTPSHPSKKFKYTVENES